VRVVILYDPGAIIGTAEDIAGVMEAVDDIARIFVRQSSGERVPSGHDRRWFNVCRRADLVFNLCEGVRGVAQWEDHVVGTLELAGIAYTAAVAGRRPRAAASGRQHAARARGLPVPRWTIAQGKIEDDFPLPAIVKARRRTPARASDPAIGRHRSQKPQGAHRRDDRAVRRVLVQQYIAGREFNVGIVGDRTLPVAEIDFSTMPEARGRFLTYAAKWHVGSPEDLGSRPVCPAQIPQRLADRLCRLAETACARCRGRATAVSTCGRRRRPPMDPGCESQSRSHRRGGGNGAGSSHMCET